MSLLWNARHKRVKPVLHKKEYTFEPGQSIFYKITLCAQRRFSIVCATTKSDLSLHDSLWLAKNQTRLKTDSDIHVHNENTPIQIYRKFHLQKLKISDKKKKQKKKKNIFFLFYISAQNIDCGYSLEPPRRGGSYEYPQSMFLVVIRKIMYTPVNPSFTI